MINVRKTGVWYRGGALRQDARAKTPDRASREKTMAYTILQSHAQAGARDIFRLRFDALASPDNVYVSILQTARASGLKSFSIPYILTNCHSTLCAVGGTINEDDHRFGLSGAMRYGGIFVPPYQAVLHQYIREAAVKGGGMVLGSDSHTRYGALGALGVGEGGGELVKHLLGQTYDIAAPEVIAVRLTGAPRHGVGPHDIALTLVRALFPDGYARNKILEFMGEGVAALSMDTRIAIDAMTTECAALSSIWITDEKTRAFYRLHGREQDFRALVPGEGAYYNGAVELALDAVEPMIALPFHPANAYTIREFEQNAPDIVRGVEREAQKTMPDFSLAPQLREGCLTVRQGVIAGCVGGLYENLCEAADILAQGTPLPAGLSLHVYPASQPIALALARNGVAGRLMRAGAVVQGAFCGPCFGVLDTPANSELSIRHVTRNFRNREGARQQAGQSAAVALMDARSIAATLANGGQLTGADSIPYQKTETPYAFDATLYARRVYCGVGRPLPDTPLGKGPNIADWPAMDALPEHLLLVVSGVYEGSVTTDELLPSGEASSYRSNPHKLAAFTMQNRDAAYYPYALGLRESAARLRSVDAAQDARCARWLALLARQGLSAQDTAVGSVLVAERIGDGSAREQAASCQRVLGGLANLTLEYSTKRYRANLINWGMLPLRAPALPALARGAMLLVRHVRDAISGGAFSLTAQLFTPRGEAGETLTLSLDALDARERAILLAGSLINESRRALAAREATARG